MHFKELSDTLDAKELAGYFDEFFKLYEGKPKNKGALQDLYELAYRQWDTCDTLSEELEEKTASYLIAAIQFDSFEIMDLIMSIVENLSLKKVFDYIIKNKIHISNPAVRSLIEEAENDYSDTIDNPFDLFDSI